MEDSPATDRLQTERPWQEVCALAPAVRVSPLLSAEGNCGRLVEDREGEASNRLAEEGTAVSDNEDAVAADFGLTMIEHMLEFAQGINDVLEYEHAEEFLLANPEKVEQLERLLKQADYSLNRVRMLALWRKGQQPEEG